MTRASFWTRAAAAVVASLVLSAPAQAQVIKMATLAPDGSSWHTILKEMGEKWKVASGGRVTLRIYPGGVAGDDADIVRKMRLGTLNAGLLTSVGIAEVDPTVYALQVPLMYRSYEEVEFVLGKMQPRLEASLAAKGFVVLHWADAGWVHFFGRNPMRTPDDLKKEKLFVWQGDSTSSEIWKSAGFNPVPLPSTEISTALQTGLITALPASPQAAVVLQWFNQAKNMTDLRWALLLGATVIKKDVWERIPADVRPALLQAAQEAGTKLRAEVRASGDRDVEAMKKRGLTVVALDDAARKQWQTILEGTYPQIRGKLVPADAFDEARRLRDEYRRAHGGR
jgi:TRAP-type C4-dicarboxylate transport system substrate-binding protein